MILWLRTLKIAAAVDADDNEARTTHSDLASATFWLQLPRSDCWRGGGRASFRRKGTPYCLFGWHALLDNLCAAFGHGEAMPLSQARIVTARRRDFRLPLFWRRIAIAPTLTLVLFRHVFGSGGSNVAQMTNDHGLWSLWFSAWPMLFFANPASVLGMLATCFIFFQPIRNPPLFLARVFGVANAMLATWITMTFFPDA